jgi:deaminated glutathione amidase
MTYGNSLIIEPWGTIAAKKHGIEPGIIYTDINLQKLYEARKAIPVSEHQKIFFNTDKLRDTHEYSGANVKFNGKI